MKSDVYFMKNDYLCILNPKKRKIDDDKGF